MSIISTVNLIKKFDNVVANDHINLSVREKEIKCIVGENGAGKTTLMNMLYGALQPTEGKIFINGNEVNFSGPLDAINYGIGMVHQHFKLVPSLTVYENILLGVEIRKEWRGRTLPLIDTAAEVEQVQRLIDKYRFQLDPADKIENLSVGLCQQVEILKMLYRNVKILILDEPTSVLTPQEVDWLIDNLKRLRDDGKTIIVITHKLREVMALSDSVTVIKNGKVAGEALASETSEKELAQMMVGRDVVLTVNNAGRRSDKIGKPAYRVSNLRTVNEAGKEVLAGISFDIHQGEILGIAGVEGNGQSELVKVLTGLMTATGGSVHIGEEDITNCWPDRLRRRKIGIIPEDRYAQGLCRDMTIAENCIAGYCDDAGISRFGIFKRKGIRRRCLEYMSKYDIRAASIDGNISQLSGGNAQKVILAREFESKPELIIACQPTRGVDVGSIEFIHRQLLDYRNAGNMVLLVSSELSEIMSLSDRIVVMYKGQIIGEADPKTTSTPAIGLLMAGTKPEGGGESA
ncbi:MAG: ABC transporter ATP-binding protein [Treponema sp.]|nr:ABC transporter ATP-binding protein [Treponema sp.]